MFVAGCPDYSADHATLYNATSFPVRVRIWSAARACADAAPRGEALSLSECVELPPDTAYSLPQVYDGDRCEFAVVQSAGLETTALAWDRDLVGGEGRGHPDAYTVYLERVADRLYLAGAPHITAETYQGELPAAECPP